MLVKLSVLNEWSGERRAAVCGGCYIYAGKVKFCCAVQDFYLFALRFAVVAVLSVVYGNLQTSLSHARLNLFGFDLFIEQPFFDITVRRLHIVEDTINTLLSSEEKYLKRPLKVSNLISSTSSCLFCGW